MAPAPRSALEDPKNENGAGPEGVVLPGVVSGAPNKGLVEVGVVGRVPVPLPALLPVPVPVPVPLPVDVPLPEAPPEGEVGVVPNDDAAPSVEPGAGSCAEAICRVNHPAINNANLDRVMNI